MEPNRLSDKKLDSLSSEELLKALQNTENTTIEIDHPIHTFLKKLDIQPGNFKVPTQILWEVFNKLNPKVLAKIEFMNNLKYFLEVEKSHVKLNKAKIVLYAEILKINMEKPKKNPVSNEANRRHFEAFLKTSGVTKGTFRITNYVFYHIYRCYCVDNKKKQLSYDNFTKLAGNYIGKLRGAACVFYLVDQKTANIHLEKEFDGIKKIYQKGSKKVKKKSV